MKKALVTGITGQDGAYLARVLLDNGYEVHGIRRRSSSFNSSRIEELVTNPNIFNNKLFLHYGDMTDSTGLSRIVHEVKPDEVYNLAAQSHVAVSFESPEYTANADALGVLRLLEIIRQSNATVKFYQASTSEMFGNSPPPQNETTLFAPQSPYATAKLFGYWITKNYRDAYSMFASNGILFNHESPLRGETFVTRKITRALTAISLGSPQKLTLGNIYATRDWGHAREYAEIIWQMMQLDAPTDLVIATGRAHSVKDFINMTAEVLGMRIIWSGSGLKEVARDHLGRIIVDINPEYFRPLEVPNLIGDASLASKVLGWKPKINLEELVKEMVENDLSIQSNNGKNS